MQAFHKIKFHRLQSTVIKNLFSFMKRSLILQIVQWILGIWLVDWDLCWVMLQGREICFLHVALKECAPRNPHFHWAIRPLRHDQFDPVKPQSMFMIKSYICVSTTKWTGRQERRSCVAGSHVSHERALYCSRTNLSTSEVWLESRGWECLLCRSSSDWTEDTCRCKEALRKSGHWFLAWGQADQNHSGSGPVLAVETK